MIPLVKENVELKTELAIPTGATIALANDAIDRYSSTFLKSVYLNHAAKANQYSQTKFCLQGYSQ